MSRIFLIGFRGSGKSALGKGAAKILDLPFVDLDEIFCKKFGDIGEFVAKNGWASFRTKESEILQEMKNFRGISTTPSISPLSGGEPEKNFIISTGGGIIELSENREFLKNEQTIFIDVPLNELVSRLIKKEGSRPRLEKGKDLETEIRENFARRFPFYEEVATSVFSPDISLSKEENSARLAEMIKDS